jgi:hypothetical protein
MLVLLIFGRVSPVRLRPTDTEKCHLLDSSRVQSTWTCCHVRRCIITRLMAFLHAMPYYRASAPVQNVVLARNFGSVCRQIGVLCDVSPRSGVHRSETVYTMTNINIRISGVWLSISQCDVGLVSKWRSPLRLFRRFYATTDLDIWFA